jgi:hypothetical protein
VSEPVNGILLLYQRPPAAGAATIMEHVDSFGCYSRFKVWAVNTIYGFPKELAGLDFGTVVLHYSLFGRPYGLNDYFRWYLEQSRAYKIAFFQDEHHYCKARFEFLDRYGIDCVYTLIEPEHWDEVYLRYTSVKKLVYGIPGYVGDELVELAERLYVPDDQRTVDVGYRGRTLLPYMGRGSQEKAEIGIEFAERARDRGLKLDIAVDERSRIYGEAWFRFLASCRAVLGVEAGVSVFDLDDSVREQYEALIVTKPDIAFAEISDRILASKEGNIPYRTISPRHFEAAALRVCQVLFDGSYSGALEPMVHYIPLRKDFSNLDQVIERFRDRDLRRTLTENAHRDLIASGAYSYKRFISEFDDGLLSLGFDPEIDGAKVAEVEARLRRGQRRRVASMRLVALADWQFPGRGVVRPLLKPVRARFGSWLHHRRTKRLASRAGT